MGAPSCGARLRTRRPWSAPSRPAGWTGPSHAPAVLNDRPATDAVRTVDPAIGEKAHKISQPDLAAWLVSQLDTTEHAHRTVTLATT